MYVMKIHTEPTCRDEGAASEALDFLCNLADELDVTLFLEVEPFGAGSLDTEQLLEWYRRFGFEGSAAEMVREPANNARKGRRR